MTASPRNKPSGETSRPIESHPTGPNRKVMHLGEVAGVASTLVAGLRRMGVDAEFRDLTIPVPEAHPLVKILRVMPRITGAREIRRELKATDAIAHVHYATSGLWFMGARPLVIHCHGDDVRDPRFAQRTVVRRILRSADMIIGATPDLLQWLPPSARYLPNPVDTETFRLTAPIDEATRDVFVFSELAGWKGAPEMLRLVNELRRERPEIRISAIDHGAHAEDFRAAGVEMSPYMSTDQLVSFINDHKVVVGQRLLGVAGTSELQAMACGRPVVMPLSSAVDRSLQPPTLAERDPVQAAMAMAELLDDPGELRTRGEEASAWVSSTHGLGAVSRTLAGWYEELD